MDPTTAAIRCAECGVTLTEGQDRQQTDDAVFCRPCFERLTREVGQVIAAQGEDVNYSMALVGGVAGGLLGALAWWGFTVVTNIAFGLVAVVIGIAVGKGVTVLSGHKRHLNLQIMSVSISIAAFAYSMFLVNRTFILRALTEQGQPVEIGLLPNPELFYRVVAAGASPMDLIFLAIVIYQAWKIPAPLQLAHS
jgi:hypothetical protein